jgi:hypothetical protein
MCIGVRKIIDQLTSGALVARLLERIERSSVSASRTFPADDAGEVDWDRNKRDAAVGEWDRLAAVVI